jgi:hypothetical protein
MMSLKANVKWKNRRGSIPEQRPGETRPQWYQRYLRCKHWLITRRLVLERANSRCEICRECHASEVHHKTYQRVGRENLDDLLAVCERCHKIQHSDGPHLLKPSSHFWHDVPDAPYYDDDMPHADCLEGDDEQVYQEMLTDLWREVQLRATED